MRRLVLLAVVVLAPASTASADGCPPSQCGTATVAVPGSSVLGVRPEGGRGRFVAYDVATGRPRFTLPPGIASADGRRFVSTRVTGGATTLRLYDVRSGRMLRGGRLAARWVLTAVSPTGRYAALVASKRRPSPRTRFGILDTARMRLVRTLALRGTFEPEAVGGLGKRLFVVQYLRRGYVVGRLDLRNGRLTALRIKGEPPLMDGIPWTGVPSPDGRWLLTLYFVPDEAEAAVHTLDLERGLAVCIDIPSGDFWALQRYTVVASPDGTRAYAANPSLGVVTEIDLARFSIVSKVHFRRVRTGQSAAFGSTGAVTVDGRTIAFSPGSGVWLYDTVSQRVRGPLRGGGRVIGLAFGKDRRRLLVVHADRSVRMLDVRTGRTLAG